MKRRRRRRRRRRNKNRNPRRKRVDRISRLPDDVLIHILSLLDTGDAVMTTTLSREWRRRRLWTHVYNLSFDFNSWFVPSQILSVARVLDLHRAAKITTFSLHIRDSMSRQTDVLVPWLRFAAMRHVEALKLCLPEIGFLFDLPEFLFSHDSLRELNVVGCDLHLQGRVRWELLRVLDMSFGVMKGIQDLLSGCPLLEYLKLSHVLVCGGQNVDITQEKLKKLVIERPYCTRDIGRRPEVVHVHDPEIRIAAPRLAELELLGCWCSITCKLVDVPSLVHVRLDFVFLSSLDNAERSKNAEKELREKVRQIMG